MIVALALLKRFWWAIPLLALSIALLATRETLHDEKRERVLAEVKLSTSNGSISRLEAELKRIADEQRELATNDAARIQQSRQQLALVDAATKVRQSVIEKLLASAEVERPPEAAAACEFSETVLAAWPQ